MHFIECSNVGASIENATAMVPVPQRGRECTVIGKNSVTLCLYCKYGLSPGRRQVGGLQHPGPREGRQCLLYRARPQNQRSRVEVKRRSKSLQEIYSKNPIDSQPRRKVYHEDFKHLDNDPFNLQALETTARYFSFQTLGAGYGTSRYWTL